MRTARISLLLHGLCLLALTAAEPVSHLPLDYRPTAGGIPVATPGENADRRGSYQAHTGMPGNDYWVHVPANYDPERPVGLALFFHGQGGQGGAKTAWSIGKSQLEQANLILINMQYQDGDNMKDPAGKVEAAKIAIAQVLADYPIVPGRGIIASFSGGGVPHALLLDQLGAERGPGRGYHWPFCHTALFGSNFRTSASGRVPMTWHIAVGQKEWDMANLGADNSIRIGELARDARSNPDFALRVEAGKGHSISEGDRAASTAMFTRSDLFFAPFIHTPDFNDRIFAKVLKPGLQLRYGETLEALDELLADEGLAAEFRPRTERLRSTVAQRADAMLALLETLAAKDPLLAAHYLGIARANHLKNHPHEERVKELTKQVSRSEAYAQAAKLAGWWFPNAHALVSGGNLKPEHRSTVEGIAEQIPAQSVIGIWAAELLKL